MKRAVVNFARPVVVASWPAIEAGARALSRMNRVSGEIVQVSDRLTDEHVAALEMLPSPPGCTRGTYLTLLKDTEYQKRHVLVRRADEPVALLSLRRRKSFWEPVTQQCLPGFIAPAEDEQALKAALKYSGLEVAVSSGLASSAASLEPSVQYGYDVYGVRLDADYEAHWSLNKRRCRNSIQKARRKCKQFDVVVDGPDDLEWGLAAWRDMWKDDPEAEVCAYPDRLNFWRALRDAPPAGRDQLGLRTLCVRDGDRIVACVIFLSCGDKLMWQSTSRSFDYDAYGVGTYALDRAIEWAREQGFKLVDLAGGGGFKADWAPVIGQRYGAEFRPAPIDFMRRIRPIYS